MEFKYQYALTSVPFDSSYENAFRFDTRAQQEAYFGTSTLFNNAKSVNFDFGNLVRTTIVIRERRSPLELMGYNYLIVKDNNEGAARRYVYYFIDDIQYIAGGNDGTESLIRLNLTMDVINTYLLDVDLGNGALIERASLDRWTKDYDEVDSVTMDLGKDSLFRQPDPEVTSPSLLMTARTYKAPHYSRDESTMRNVIEWIDKNVSAWLYVYVDRAHSWNSHYDLGGGGGVTASIPDYMTCDNLAFTSKTDYIPDYGTIVVPIYKTDKVIKVRYMACITTGQSQAFAEYQMAIDVNGLNGLRDLNNNSSYIFTQKLSVKPPMSFHDLHVAAEQDSDGNLILVGGKNPDQQYSEYGYSDFGSPFGVLMSVYHNIMFFAQTKDQNQYLPWRHNTTTGVWTPPSIADVNSHDFSQCHGVFVGSFQRLYDDMVTDPVEFDIPYDVRKDKGHARIKENCPKLYTAPNSEIRIQCNGDAVSYTVSDLSLGDKENSLSLLYDEVVQPEISKFYVRPQAPIGIYDNFYNDNLSGLVSSFDSSIVLVNDAYSAFLASNKNFWLQSFASALTGGASGLPDSWHAGHPVSDISRTTLDQEPIGGRFKSPITGRYVPLGSPERPMRTIGSQTVNSTTTVPGYMNWSSVGFYGLAVARRLIDTAITIDNVKASPSNMKNSTGNAFFSLATTGLGLYVEQYKLLDADRDRIYDFYYMYGYPVNRTGSVDDYINIRYYFNYIQATLQNVTGKRKSTITQERWDIPNQIRDELKRIFHRGIRFWNEGTGYEFHYDMENFERRLK